MADDARGAADGAAGCYHGHRRRWWKEAVVYHVWPRSFMDADGDGIGDLRGIIQRLDHVAALGVDALWISPHYDSPNVDNGYDVRDYRAVMAEFGTMADFDALVAAAKARGLRLLVDLVANHSSAEHAWFVESRRSRENPYRDYYIWHPGRAGGPPNDWRSFFGGSAWSWDDVTAEYYLHLFAPEQPDLNWENPQVRREIYEIMRFWLDKGVDGFRMDVIPFISKDRSFADYPPEHRARPHYHHAAGPRLHAFLQEMGREVLAPYGAVSIGEALGVTPEQARLLVDERHGELDMLIHFDALLVDRGEGWRWRPSSLPDLKAVFTRLEAALDHHCWRTVCLSNHDMPRLVSHFGDDSPAWRVRSAQVLATLLLTVKGTPLVYQGDEIGMTNYPFADIAEFEDVEALGAWRVSVEEGDVPPQEFLAHMRRTSRDNARTPVQWDDGPNGGFTTGTPWFPVNPNVAEIDARADRAAPASVFRHYAAVIALRKHALALVYGDFTDLDPAHRRLFVYTRRAGDEGYLIVLNLSGDEVGYDLPATARPGAFVLGNLAPPADAGARLTLAPWEARIYRLAGEPG